MAMKDGEAGFHGYRYLLDASGTEEYAVRFDNGKPTKPILVFDAQSPGASFPANATIFALDDETEIASGPRGSRLSTTLFQITTDANGVPRNLKMCSCDYDIRLTANGSDVAVSYELSQASQIMLSNMDFSPKVPKQFTGRMNAVEAKAWRHGASVMVDPAQLRQLPFPPHHAGGALLARTSADATKDVVTAAAAVVSSAYTKVDAQTLMETKKLGGGEKLKIIFDFEARRVTEIVETSSKMAMTGHSFDEHDHDALDKAYQQLVDLKGAPKPIDGKRKPSLKIDPK